MDLDSLFLKIVERLHGIRIEIASCAITREHCEALLKSQLMNLFGELRRDGVLETYGQERPYGRHHIYKAKCDLFFQLDGKRYWMELNTFPTNYCSGGGSPITNHIAKVKGDLEKVRTIGAENEIPLVLMLAYPFSGNEWQWDTHLSRLKGTGFAWMMERISLRLDEIIRKLSESRMAETGEPIPKWKYGPGWCYVYLFYSPKHV